MSLFFWLRRLRWNKPLFKLASEIPKPLSLRVITKNGECETTQKTEVNSLFEVHIHAADESSNKRSLSPLAATEFTGQHCRSTTTGALINDLGCSKNSSFLYHYQSVHKKLMFRIDIRVSLEANTQLRYFCPVTNKLFQHYLS